MSIGGMEKRDIRNVNLNQVGFMTKARKTCVVRSEGIDGAFSVLNENKEEVFKGSLTGPIKAVYAEEEVYQGDFSEFNVPGTYTVKVSNGDESHPFVIGDNVYDDLLKDSLLMLTRQRCGMELTKEIAGPAAHPSCHDTDAVIYGTDKYKNVNGGWHDAGDYGRYIVAAATAIDDLYLAYEEFTELWKSDNLGTPESGNGIPDILNEAKYELDWMLKMQDEETGGVYHKVTCYKFPGFVMPEEETEELVISPISITATADFAAIMAKTSTIFKEIDAQYSANALKCAKKAYDYAVSHKDEPGFKNPADIRTGEYGDANNEDELYWAAVEMFKVTGEQRYKDDFESILNKTVYHGFGWDDMGSYGNVAFLSLDEKDQDPALKAKMIESITKKADEYLANVKADGYMCDLDDKYIWGSNLLVCSFAREMMIAAKYGNTEELNQAAYDQISYLLGQNATGYSFVTGYGAVAPIHPHHRPSEAANYTVPGMVVGGPNKGLQDAFVKEHFEGVAPAKVYADVLESYSTNEITIYWNSPFIYLLSAQIMMNK